MNASTPMLRAVELHKSFGAVKALRGANLTVQPGELLAIMGPSGSGKSTLLHCLAGILVPETGEVWLEGTKLSDLTEGARTTLRRSQYGFVFQFGQLVPELTAIENVALSLLLAGKKREEASRPANHGLSVSILQGWRSAGPGRYPADRHNE